MSFFTRAILTVSRRDFARFRLDKFRGIKKKKFYPSLKINKIKTKIL